MDLATTAFVVVEVLLVIIFAISNFSILIDTSYFKLSTSVFLSSFRIVSTIRIGIAGNRMSFTITFGSYPGR